MEANRAERFTLPNGHELQYIPAEIDGGEAYILEVYDGKELVGRTCSCNGVSRACPKGQSPVCDCTKNPPVLTCA